MSDKEFVDALVSRCQAIEGADFFWEDQEVTWIPEIRANYPWYGVGFKANNFNSSDIEYISDELNSVARAHQSSLGAWHVFSKENKVFLRYEFLRPPSDKKSP